MIGTLIAKVLTFIVSMVRSVFQKLNIPSLIYDTFITKPLTRYAYKQIAEEAYYDFRKANSLLDVGTGTGEALMFIKQYIPASVKIVGIDIDPYYIEKAKKRFQNDKNAEMRFQDFYTLENTKEKYDIIIFSGSFMLMPDQDKALEVAKKLLNPGGKIYFFMTLYAKRRVLLEKIKPLIKDYTSIDFGKITYENEFVQLLEKNNLTKNKMMRIMPTCNFLFHIFRVFMIEAQPSKK
jgi:ubiquinone/menaquinone biosynthesis C-methylase UbiE